MNGSRGIASLYFATRSDLTVQISISTNRHTPTLQQVDRSAPATQLGLHICNRDFNIRSQLQLSSYQKDRRGKKCNVFAAQTGQNWVGEGRHRDNQEQQREDVCIMSETDVFGAIGGLRDRIHPQISLEQDEQNEQDNDKCKEEDGIGLLGHSVLCDGLACSPSTED